ncbi:MAG: hypothetical protein C4516_00110 [Oxalobacter sp.]|nr:MAG: hypothetical protein C4516_00110 [Oxalobacter sp.]
MDTNMNKSPRQTASDESMEPAYDTLRRYAVHLLADRERERLKLATEIHDKIGQNLLALKIDISMLHVRTRGNHPLINSKAESLLKEIDVAIQNTKSIINSLHPPVLDLGLLAAIDWQIKEFEKLGAMTCTASVNGDEETFAAYNHYTLPVIRILHEAFINAMNHGKARAACVSLSTSENMLTVQVYDDGIGIRPDDLNKPNAYGLLGIREYARMKRGTFTMMPHDPSGTLMTVQLPARDRQH